MVREAILIMIGAWLDVILFIVASSFAYFGIKENQKKQSYRESIVETTGWRWRIWIYRGLFASLSTRSLALLVLAIVVHPIAVKTTAQEHIWFTDSIGSHIWCLLYWIPSFIMVTVYSLIVLFSAQLCYACWGISSHLLGTICLVLNIIVSWQSF